MASNVAFSNVIHSFIGMFSSNFKINDVYIEGITKVSNIDLEMANKLGYTILLLGISNIKNKVIQLGISRTKPARNRAAFIKHGRWGRDLGWATTQD